MGMIEGKWIEKRGKRIEVKRDKGRGREKDEAHPRLQGEKESHDFSHVKNLIGIMCDNVE